jgi:hypothetical protein
VPSEWMELERGHESTPLVTFLSPVAPHPNTAHLGPCEHTIQFFSISTSSGRNELKRLIHLSSHTVTSPCIHLCPYIYLGVVPRRPFIIHHHRSPTRTRPTPFITTITTSDDLFATDRIIACPVHRSSSQLSPSGARTTSFHPGHVTSSENLALATPYSRCSSLYSLETTIVDSRNQSHLKSPPGRHCSTQPPRSSPAHRLDSSFVASRENILHRAPRHETGKQRSYLLVDNLAASDAIQT